MHKLERAYIVTEVKLNKKWSGDPVAVQVTAVEEGNDESRIVVSIPINDYRGGIEIGSVLDTGIEVTSRIRDLRPALTAGDGSDVLAAADDWWKSQATENAAEDGEEE